MGDLVRDEGDDRRVGRLGGHGPLDGGQRGGHVVDIAAAAAGPLGGHAAAAAVVPAGMLLLLLLLLLLSRPHLVGVVAPRLVREVRGGGHGGIPWVLIDFFYILSTL